MARRLQRRQNRGALRRFERFFFPDWARARDRRRRFVMALFLLLAGVVLVSLAGRRLGIDLGRPLGVSLPRLGGHAPPTGR